MHDIFLELDIITKELNLAKEQLNNHQLYFEDAMESNYNNEYLIKYGDWCLEYIDFLEYTTLASEKLNEILIKLTEESKNYIDKIKYLKKLKKKYEEMIIKSTTLNNKEYECLCVLFNINNDINNALENINLFTLIDNKLTINPLLDNINNDIINFIQYYTNLKYNMKDNISILDIYTIYQRYKSKRLYKLK